MKKVKYKLSKNEYIGLVSFGSIILNAYLIEESFNEGLIYIPKRIEYRPAKGDKSVYSSECDSLSFAVYNTSNKMWQRSQLDYLNLDSSNAWEKRLKRPKRGNK